MLLNASCFGPGDACWNEICLVAPLLFQPLLHSTSYILIILIILTGSPAGRDNSSCWGLRGTILYKSVRQLPKSQRDKVLYSVLHQMIALLSLCKSIPHSFARFISILETKHVWMSESWQTFQAPALLLAECWAVLWLGCCTVIFRLWNLVSVEMVLLQLHGMLLLSPTICQFLWLRRYKVCMPAWLVSALKIPQYCVQTEGSVLCVRKHCIIWRKTPQAPWGKRKKNLLLVKVKRWNMDGENVIYGRIIANKLYGEGCW